MSAAPQAAPPVKTQKKKSFITSFEFLFCVILILPGVILFHKKILTNVILLLEPQTNPAFNSAVEPTSGSSGGK